MALVKDPESGEMLRVLTPEEEEQLTSRRRAGAPRRTSQVSKAWPVMLTATEHEHAIQVGEGNFSRGIQRLLAEHRQRLKAEAQRVKVEQTKEWLRDWRSNPTASTDAPEAIVTEPGQEMLPPPGDPTTEETALGDPREDSGALEALALDGYWLKSQGPGDEPRCQCGRSDCADCIAI